MSSQFPNLQSNLHCWTAIGLLGSAQLSANGANEADCRSWKEANLPQDGDKLTHFTQTFAHLLHLVTRHLHSKSLKIFQNFIKPTFLFQLEGICDFCTPLICRSLVFYITYISDISLYVHSSHIPNGWKWWKTLTLSSNSYISLSRRNPKISQLTNNFLSLDILF